MREVRPYHFVCVNLYFSALIDRNTYIDFYHRLGLKHKNILLFMAQNHGCIVSERHLRRILSKLGLYQRQRNDITHVANFISQQMDESGRQHGYRMMYLKCKLAGCSLVFQYKC